MPWREMTAESTRRSYAIKHPQKRDEQQALLEEEEGPLYEPGIAN